MQRIYEIVKMFCSVYYSVRFSNNVTDIHIMSYITIMYLYQVLTNIMFYLPLIKRKLKLLPNRVKS